jgi:LysM repeat protein
MAQAPTNTISNSDVEEYKKRVTDLTLDKGYLQSSGVNPASIIKTPVVTQKAPIVTPTSTVNAGGSYAVKQGDSLSKIASQNGMTLSQLLELNPTYKANPNLVKVGASLNVNKAPVADPTKNTVVADPTKVTQTPEQIKLAEDTKLAEEAGKAGLSVSEYQTVMNTRNTVSKEESDAIAKELGITALEGEVFKKPSQSSQQVYDSAYATAGLADIKGKIDALNTEIAKDRANLAEAVGTIDENPFLTEKSRVGRGKRVLDQAEAKINNKIAQVKSYTDLYTAGVNEINNLVTRNQNDFNINQTVDSAKLNYLLKKAETQVSQLQDKKNISANTTLGAYLKAKQTGKTPDVIGTSDTGYFKYDSATGKFVQVIKPAPKSTSGSSDTWKPSSGDKSVVGQFINSSVGATLGFTDADKARLDTDQNFFYWALNKAKEEGFY